ncbi:hypothetical protein [Legionella santicrucis]|nr:hypothetical protein [Legionella santicrucis]
MPMSNVSIFNFSTFISALSLFLIVFTIIDIRYRFRVAVAPFPLFKISLIAIAVLGLGTLVLDTGSAEGWSKFLGHQDRWQAALGLIFLSLIFIWILFIFKPSKFSKCNAKKFAQHLYLLILKGSDTELAVISEELKFSAESLVELTKENTPNEKISTPKARDYAYEILSLIGNRKFCQHVVANAPFTAIILFESIAKTKKYNIPIGQFTKNITTEAILNKNSILYHEDEGYKSGLLGYIKPFSRVVYGNHHLVEELGVHHASPLDIHIEIKSSWDAAQLNTYCRCVMLSFKNYIDTANWNEKLFSLCRAFENIRNSCGNIYKLNEADDDLSNHTSYNCLNITVEFFKEAIDYLSQQENTPPAKLKRRNNSHSYEDIYDYFTNHLFEIIHSAAYINCPNFNCWMIQHNIVWYAFFKSHQNQRHAWKIIHSRLRRLLYNEIKQLETYPNYKGARILGYLLNIMGLKLGEKSRNNRAYYSFHKIILKWVENNYLSLVGVEPTVASSCLPSGFLFNEKEKQIEKTYSIGMGTKTQKDSLTLT